MQSFRVLRGFSVCGREQVKTKGSIKQASRPNSAAAGGDYNTEGGSESVNMGHKQGLTQVPNAPDEGL